MVWACISSFGVSEIIFIDGVLTGKKYAKVLEDGYIPFVRDVLKDIPDNWILVEDNDKKHTSPEATKFRRENQVERL